MPGMREAWMGMLLNRDLKVRETRSSSAENPSRDQYVPSGGKASVVCRPKSCVQGAHAMTIRGWKDAAVLHHGGLGQVLAM